MSGCRNSFELLSLNQRYARYLFHYRRVYVSVGLNHIHMFLSFFLRVGLAAAMVGMFWLPLIVVSAQSEAPQRFTPRAFQPQTDSRENRVVLTGYNARQFPAMELRMEAWDAQGNFLSGLEPERLEVIENGTRIRPDRVEVIDVGLRFTLAVNITPVLGSQSQGASQYEHLRQLLLRWARSQQSRQGDFSFSTPTGLYVIRSEQPSELIQALQDYQPDLVKMQPSLNSLAEALNLANEPAESNAELINHQAILYITPPLPASLEVNLPDLTRRATELGVRVFVWLVAPSTSIPLGPDHPLRQMAEGTGGVFQQVYLPDSSLDIETLVDPLRKMYRVQYVSALRQGGDHKIFVEVDEDGEILRSNTQAFNINLQPPNPIFLSPPAVIERSWNLAVDRQPVALAPEQVDLQIVIEFPDSFSRALTGSRLYVNRILVDENTSPPYDQFSWSLDGVEETGQHLLRVEVVDEFGMTGASLELPIDVHAPALLQEKLPDQISSGVSTRNLAILISVILSGAVLIFVLVFNGRRNKTFSPVARGSRTQGKTARRPVSKVVVRPAAIQTASVHLEQHGEAGTSPGRLINLNEEEQPVVGAAIPITNQGMTFGSDPKRATQLIESPTVDGLHARIYRNGNNGFYLADENSVAGTWINYAPITTRGTHLEHGDLVHFGRVLFRFELSDPVQGQIPEVKVIGPDDSIAQGTGSQK